MMPWRRRKGGYAVLSGESEDWVHSGRPGHSGDGDKDRVSRGFWALFMVGVGSISNLYLPVGDFCELDLGASSRLDALFEEDITELVEIRRTR